MAKELFTLAEKIRQIREQNGITQSALAKSLGISRSGVNAWEMGLSIPSTQYIVEIAKTFHVSTDYLLGMEETATVSVKGLTEKQVAVILDIVHCLRHPEQ